MKLQLTINIIDESGNNNDLYRNFEFDPEELRNRFNVDIEATLGQACSEMVETIMSTIN